MSEPVESAAYTYNRYDHLDEKSLMGLPDDHADAYMVDRSSAAMLAKMVMSAEKGRGGWHTDQCSDAQLLQMLKEHVEKGDMVDVLNLAGMLFVRQDARTRTEVVKHNSFG